MKVRVPHALASYACGRSLQCCHSPFRAAVTPEDDRRIRERLGLCGASQTLVRYTAALGPERGGVHLIDQTQGGCRLLAPEPQPGSCRLQTGGGAAAMPAACWSFPRSVVQTPAGVEVAFLLACPTAAARVAAGPAAFAWAEPTCWAYPPTREVHGPLPCEPGDPATLSLPLLDVLRREWWTRLASVRSGAHLLRVLSGLSSSPSAPTETQPGAFGALAAPAARQVAFVATGLPQRGEHYLGGRERMLTGLTTPLDERVVEATAEQHLSGLCCAAALCVQHAGLHDEGYVWTGLRAAAWQVGLALGVTCTLSTIPGVSPTEALADALYVAGRLACGRHSGASLA